MTALPLGGKPPQKPDEFIETFLSPALALWRDKLNSKLLAICAVSQLDILVEVVFNHLEADGRQLAKSASDYRVDLGKRRRPLALVSDAHDTHKHGALRDKKNVRLITRGQGQIRTAGTALFVGYGRPGQKRFFGKTDTSFVLNDGTILSARTVIRNGVSAWNDEFAQLGLPHRVAIPKREE